MQLSAHSDASGHTPECMPLHEFTEPCKKREINEPNYVDFLSLLAISAFNVDFLKLARMKESRADTALWTYPPQLTLSGAKEQYGCDLMRIQSPLPAAIKKASKFYWPFSATLLI